MAIETIACTVNLTSHSQEKLRKRFKRVHYHPDGDIPTSTYAEIDMLFVSGRGVPFSIASFDQTSRLKHIQLATAGADKPLSSPAVLDYIQRKKDGITLATAAGTHVLSIPNYVTACVINLFLQIPQQLMIARNEKRWSYGLEVDQRGQTYYARSTFGRTAGILGYGSLGRETARLLKAHGMNIIAANTSGTPTKQTGYIAPGTGDADGSIPSEYYSTSSSESLETFLSRCDVLVASLPSTKETKYMLTRERMALLPKDAVFVNIGRGSLIKSETLIEALDAPNGLFGAAIDVTDPEPLPTGHPLWTHPKCIVTPHLSGDTEGEFDIATDIAIANADRIDNGEIPFNLVDYHRGY